MEVAVMLVCGALCVKYCVVLKFAHFFVHSLASFLIVSGMSLTFVSP